MELKKIYFETKNLPKELIARCPTCRMEIQRDSWESLADHQRKKRLLTKAIAKCPFCGERFKEKPEKAIIPWERLPNGDYIAKAKNGDFLVWKEKGKNGYKCRYRNYGTKSPDGIVWASTKDKAMAMCTVHEEWKV